MFDLSVTTIVLSSILFYLWALGAYVGYRLATRVDPRALADIYAHILVLVWPITLLMLIISERKRHIFNRIFNNNPET